MKTISESLLQEVWILEENKLIQVIPVKDNVGTGGNYVRVYSFEYDTSFELPHYTLCYSSEEEHNNAALYDDITKFLPTLSYVETVFVENLINIMLSQHRHSDCLSIIHQVCTIIEAHSNNDNVLEVFKKQCAKIIDEAFE